MRFWYFLWSNVNRLSVDFLHLVIKNIEIHKSLRWLNYKTINAGIQWTHLSKHIVFSKTLSIRYILIKFVCSKGFTWQQSGMQKMSIDCSLHEIKIVRIIYRLGHHQKEYRHQCNDHNHLWLPALILLMLMYIYNILMFPSWWSLH